RLAITPYVRSNRSSANGCVCDNGNARQRATHSICKVATAWRQFKKNLQSRSASGGLVAPNVGLRCERSNHLPRHFLSQGCQPWRPPLVLLAIKFFVSLPTFFRLFRLTQERRNYNPLGGEHLGDGRYVGNQS